ESLDSTGGWLSASRFKRCAYSMNSGLVPVPAHLIFSIVAITVRLSIVCELEACPVNIEFII
ncbi:hypothetical protein, partial [Pseudomonas helleri]|uniref:hypothetical protein n=1 Tax=Pseudomonas helleri TaxID=1608996 RepID=UPI001E347D7A